MEYPPPKEGSTESKKIIQVGSKRLLLVIHQNDEITSLYIGGKDMYCINALITSQTSRLHQIDPERFPINVASLQNVEYNKNCSLENNFQRGVDTNMIIRVLQSYIRKHYPYVDLLTFQDASYRTCDSGQEVSLSKMSYLLTGKTWYEKNYWAYLHGFYLEDFKRKDAAFQAAKDGVTWEILGKFIPTGKIADLESVYSASSWHQFFTAVRDKLGMSEFCSFVSPWLEDFFTHFMPFQFPFAKYRMPVNGDIEFRELPYNIGGRRSTRKKVKAKPRDLR